MNKNKVLIPIKLLVVYIYIVYAGTLNLITSIPGPSVVTLLV